MTLLLDATALDVRREVARGPLAELSAGLRAELAPVLAGKVEIPREKALLSRVGGRCPRDGTLLQFDPVDPRHICPTCGDVVAGDAHDRFRPYWYQLWLAERVLHAALLGALLDDAACVAAASSLLDALARQYLEYPNRDNVLGPSRPFFSTYLESIWLLQLSVAMDLLESGAPSPAMRALGDRVRDRIVEPSVRLIASYDEGTSNRQVWNDAAMLAAGVLLERESLIDHAIDGPSGLHALLRDALLDDGSWYEGENYHLFAHRGLWYGVVMAERQGREMPRVLRERFQEGFAAPFRTLLPDLTYPSRRDSQYAVSVRQPRFAESCELGVARADDPRLIGMLARLYDPAIPRANTGRAASTADVERNLPSTGLTRADLSWRSLLFARAELPPLVPHPLGSDLLPAQGFGILRREAGELFVGLDYGHSGGGHGHPDRLNLLLSDGQTRWFDDPGTGSYVDESLHWYRSTLAHTAPLLDGRSQPRVDGELVAFEDRDGEAGWISARAELAPGCEVRRSLIVLDDYLVDVVEWASDEPHELALPLHGIHALDALGAIVSGTAAPIDGGTGVEDGFAFLRDTMRLDLTAGLVRLRGIDATSDGHSPLDGWLLSPDGATWWSAIAPGAPGRAPRPVTLVRARAARGRFASVWSWRGAIRSVHPFGDSFRVARVDGSVDTHTQSLGGWRIELAGESATLAIELGGFADAPSSDRSSQLSPAPPPRRTAQPIALPVQIQLGEAHYRRSEESWEEAGRPTAVVGIERERDELVVTVDVERSARLFVPIDAENPFDNDPAAIHGDSVQLYLDAGGQSVGWLLAPVAGSSEVGVRVAEGWAGSLRLGASWHETATGYALVARVELPPRITELALDVLVNETIPGRARRRGQLVMSGGRGDFVYLRSDRHERERLVPLAVRPD